MATERFDGNVEMNQPDHAPILHQEVARLPQKYREAVVLCYLEGYTYEAAAARLSRPVGTIKVRLSRACGKTREVRYARLRPSDGVLLLRPTDIPCVETDRPDIMPASESTIFNRRVLGPSLLTPAIARRGEPACSPADSGSLARWHLSGWIAASREVSHEDRVYLFAVR